MPVTNGTVSNVFGFSPILGPIRDGTVNQNEIASFYIGVNVSGVYDQAANSQVVNLPTAIQNYMRNGRLITPLDAAFAAPGDENGILVGAKNVAIVGNTLTFELTGPDMVTERAATTLGIFNRPIAFFISAQLNNN